MSLLQRNLRQIWEQLRAKKQQMPQLLESVRICHLRGIENLPIRFDYPVTVIAGPNGCGKSTVLFASACAYDTEYNYSPNVLFPNLKSTNISDDLGKTSFEYFFYENGIRLGMLWKRGKSWNKSFMGRKNVSQPKRSLYVRTLANLTNPSEVSSFLQIGPKDDSIHSAIDADLIAFAHRVLPFKYSGMTLLQRKGKDLLYVKREDSTIGYSEFHMSAGERALLRISKDISRLNSALILIDEIEAGLHPYTQQQLMLELQRLSLRNNLQIIVTSHSSIILESVPPEGRIFLERTANNVLVLPPYRDIFQRAFYGQSQNKLSILCEDLIAEGLILGVLDLLNPKLNLVPNDVIVGRDTGKSQFPQHIETLGKFQLLSEFVFVLDGDAHNIELSIQASAQRFNRTINPLFLPGTQAPEDWIYQALEKNANNYAEILGVPGLDQQLINIRQSFASAADKPSNIVKNRFQTFAELIQRTPEDIARIVARKEAIQGEMKIFSDNLEQAIYNWRNQIAIA